MPIKKLKIVKEINICVKLLKTIQEQAVQQKGKDDAMTTSEKIFNLGKEEGLKAGKISQLFDLTHKQIISAEIAAQQANMTEQEFCEQMKLAGYAD